jgi:hypothetical protein
LRSSGSGGRSPSWRALEERQRRRQPRILFAGWAALTHGFPIVCRPPVCEEAWPLSDLAHVGSIVFGILLPVVSIWSLWRARARPGPFLPAIAAALVIGTVVALANTPIT